MSQKQASNTSDEQDGKSFWTKTEGILTAIAAVLTAIGGVVAALSAAGLIPSLASIIATPTTTLVSPASTSIPPISTLIQSTATPTIPPMPLLPTLTADWSISWRLDFDPGFWPEGANNYTLVEYCINTFPAAVKNSWRITFQVSKQARLIGRIGSFVYLGPNGLADENGIRIDSIHPSQPTSASILHAGLTKPDANSLAQYCSDSVIINGLPPRTLIPVGPYQQ
jgi:hypothetical protein